MRKNQSPPLAECHRRPCMRRFARHAASPALGRIRRRPAAPAWHPTALARPPLAAARHLSRACGGIPEPGRPRPLTRRCLPILVLIFAGERRRLLGPRSPSPAPCRALAFRPAVAGTSRTRHVAALTEKKGSTLEKIRVKGEENEWLKFNWTHGKKRSKAEDGGFVSSHSFFVSDIVHRNYIQVRPGPMAPR